MKGLSLTFSTCFGFSTYCMSVCVCGVLCDNWKSHWPIPKLLWGDNSGFISLFLFFTDDDEHDYDNTMVVGYWICSMSLCCCCCCFRHSKCYVCINWTLSSSLLSSYQCDFKQRIVVQIKLLINKLTYR